MVKKYLKRSVGIGAMVILLSSCFQDSIDTPPPLGVQLQAELDRQLSELNLQGLSVSILWANDNAWTGVGGFSHEATPIQTDHVFGAGSITKHFMATLMLLLAQDGVISLEDPISRWLSNLNPNIDTDASIAQLLNHTSGIASYTESAEAIAQLFQEPARSFTADDILSYVGEPLFEKGTSWTYSNTNYYLLGMIAESATGTQLPSLLQDYIFGPLNLESTFFPTVNWPDVSIAHPWSGFGASNVRDLYDLPRTSVFTASWAAGAILSTTQDLATYMRAVYYDGFLAKESLDLMITHVPVNTPVFPHIGGYGLGSMQYLTLREYWGHSGDIFGYGALAGYIPQDEVSIAILANQDINEDEKRDIFQGFIRVLSNNQ